MKGRRRVPLKCQRQDLGMMLAREGRITSTHHLIHLRDFRTLQILETRREAYMDLHIEAGHITASQLHHRRTSPQCSPKLAKRTLRQWQADRFRLYEWGG